MSSPTEKNSDQKACKGRRTQRIATGTIVRQQLPAPHPVPDPQLMPLPPPVITTEEEDNEPANNLVLPSQGGNLIDRAAAGQLSDEEEDLQLAHNLILLPRGNNLIDQEAAKQSSGTPTSQSQPPSAEMEKASAEIEIGPQDTIVPSCQSVQSMAQRTDCDYTCNICNKKFNSVRALGGHRAIHSKEREHRCQECPAVFNSGPGLSGHMKKHRPLDGGGDALKNKKAKVATQQQPNRGLDRVAVQQPANDGLDRSAIPKIAIQQQPDGGLDRIGIVQQQIAIKQQPDGGSDRIGIVQQQPNGGLNLDLNLPADPDQDDTIQQPPVPVQPCDADPEPTILLFGKVLKLSRD